MRDFIKTQYRLYIMGGKSIGLEKIKKLTNLYMTEQERKELFYENK